MATIEETLKVLRSGFGTTDPSNHIKHLFQTWTLRLGPIHNDEYRQVAEGLITFRALFPKMRLRGVGEMPAIVLGAVDLEAAKAISAVQTEIGGGQCYGLILCLTEAAYDAVMARHLPQNSIVVLGPEEVQKLLTSQLPVEQFKQHLREQIGIYGLIPFATIRPASGAMFVGRTHELQMLVNEDQDFALCGPGGLGKSSLIKHAIWTLRQKRSARYTRVVEVDLGACPRNLVAATREIAKRISPHRESHQVTLESFEAVLRYLKAHNLEFKDGPIDLFLDEMDDILSLDSISADEDTPPYPLMRALRHARMLGLIRITISGRFGTKKMMEDKNNPFSASGSSSDVSRIKLIELDKLESNHSIELLMKPLEDLGVDLTCNRGDFLKQLARCNGVPFDIQNLGLDLAHHFAKRL